MTNARKTQTWNMIKNIPRIMLFPCIMGSISISVTAHADDLSRPPHFEKVFTVVFENAGYKDALKRPFFSRLARMGTLFTNYHGVTHPSQPNYIAMISGSTHKVKTNKSVDLDANHVGDLLEAKGKTWKAYVDQYPGNCFTGKSSGSYVRKHLPFMSFLNIQENFERCHSRIVNSDQLDQDIQSGTLPNYSLYIPDLKNSGHDTGLAFADQWLSERFEPLLSDPRFMDGLLFIVTFDEGNLIGPNQIFTVAYGGRVKPGFEVNTDLNHYSLLRLIEDEWNLGNLRQEDVKATPIEDIWQ